MASRPMEGVRILEVAQFTFTPSAGAVLADWGADVVKVEHATTGDAQRGMGGLSGWKDGSYHPIIEHPNRGKRSIGLALEQPGRARAALRPGPRERRVPHQLPARRPRAVCASTSTTSGR